MERLTALSRGTQLMLAAGVLLLLATIPNWQEVEFDVVGFESEVGVSAWHGFWGWVMGLALIALLAWLVARIAGVAFSLPISETLIAAGLAALILICAVIKNLVDDYSTFWSYIGVVLAALIAVGAWLEVQSAGGVDTLRSEVSSVGSTRASSTSPPAGGAGTATDVPTPAPEAPPPPPATPAPEPPAAPREPTATPEPPPSTPPSERDEPR
jgi:hypothetical protein